MPSAPATAKLTASQVAGVARQAGFPESEIPTAVAVAHAESGFNPRAHNAVPPDNSYGLWQINMLGSLGPGRRKAFGISSNDALFDPATNARAAHKIWEGGGKSWRPWTTYTHGTYKAYINDAPGGSTPLDADDVKQKVLDAREKAGLNKPLFQMVEKLAEALETLRKASWTWLVVLLAIAMIILGVVILNRNSIRKTAKTAVAVAGVIK